MAFTCQISIYIWIFKIYATLESSDTHWIVLRLLVESVPTNRTRQKHKAKRRKDWRWAKKVEVQNLPIKTDIEKKKELESTSWHLLPLASKTVLFII